MVAGTPLAEAFVRLRADGSALGTDTRRALGSAGVTSHFDAAGKQAGTRFGSSFRRTATGLLAGFGIAALGREVYQFGKESIGMAADFGVASRQIGVATDANKRQMHDLNDLAIQLGQDTIFSASEAQGAMLDLAKGGLNPAQIEAGALRDALTLAAAGNIDLETAAGDVVQTMGAFRLRASETDSAIAALAGAANASTADVGDMAIALSQAGTSAHGAGFSVQETTALLAALSNAGIQGSDAGTSLRTMFTRLVPQTEKAKNVMRDLGIEFTNADGSFKSATEVAGILQDRLGRLTAEERARAIQTLFGADSQRAANVLIEEGADGIAKYIRATSDQTQAQKLANAATSGARGSFEALKGTVETATLQFGRGLIPTVKEGADGLNDLINRGDFQDWGRKVGRGIEEGAEIIGDLAETVQPLAEDLLPLLATNAELFFAAFGGGTRLLTGVLDIVNSLPGPLQTLVVATAALGATGTIRRVSAVSDAITTYATNLRNAETRSATFGRTLRGGALGIGLGSVATGLTETNDALSSIETIGGFAALGFGVGGGGIGALIGAAAGGMVALAHATGLFGDSAEEEKPAIDDLTDTLNQLTGATTRATRVEVARSLQQKGVVGQARELGISTRDLVDAALGSADAEGRVNTALDNRRDTLVRIIQYQKEHLGQNYITPQVLQASQKALEDFDNTNHGFIDTLRGVSSELGEQIARNRQLFELIHGKTAPSVEQLDHVMRKLPKNVRSEINTLGVDVTRADLIDIDKRYDNIDRRDLRALIELLGVGKAQNEADSVINRLAFIAGMHPSPGVTVNTAGARAAVEGLQADLVRIDGTQIDYFVQGHFNTTGALARELAGGANGMTLDFNTAGDIRDGHVAQIAPAGTWRVWAEEETGGEAYIPLGAAKRARSLAIWAETGRRLGAMATQADGSVSGGRVGRGGPLRVVIDFGGGRMLEGWIDDRIDGAGEHDATVRRMNR